MKYIITNEVHPDNPKLRRIKRISDGEIGGYIESEHNLSQDGDCWVSGDATVYGTARVYRNAWACGNARVYGNAHVSGYSRVCGNAQLYGNEKVSK